MTEQERLPNKTLILGKRQVKKMANKIKGLTIEIGGETTLLQKSMGEVNKKTKDLKTELRDVERLLKLDPGNTDLISQKQKILADAVGGTKDKLDQLKQAEKEVQAQFERGEVSEDQFRALQREVIKTESDLEKLEKQAKDFGGTMKQQLKKAGDSMQDFGGKVKGAGEALTPLSVGAAGILTGLVANVSSTKEYREEMGKLETAFTTSGHTAEDAKEVYEGFYSVLGEEDRSVEAVSHLAKLTTSQEELADWTTIATGVYATFGDSLPIEGLTEAANETSKTGAITGVLADALNWAGVSEEDFQAKLDATNTEKERATLITETLNGLYSESANKYREVNGELLAANEAQGSLNDATATMGEVMQPIVNDIMSALSEALQDVADWMASLDDGTLKMILTILAIVATIAPLLIIIGQVITAVGVITEALPVLGLAFKAMTGPVGIAIAAIAAVIAIGVLLYKNWDEIKEKAAQLWEYLKQKFSDIKDAIMKPINTAIDTLKNINLVDVGKNILNSLLDGLKNVWSSISGWVTEKVDWIKNKLSVWKSASKDMDSSSNPSSYIDGSHKSGLDSVPWDGYIAELHKGERVLTAQEANSTRSNVVHTGTIRVEGVNDSGQLSGVVDIVMDQLRREVRMA